MLVKRKWVRAMATAHAPRIVVQRGANELENGSGSDLAPEAANVATHAVTPSGNITVADSDYAGSPLARRRSGSRHA